VPTRSRVKALTILQSESLARIPWFAARFQYAVRRIFKDIRRRAQLGIHQARFTPRSRAQPRSVPKKNETVENGRPWPLVTLRQIHSDVIHCVTDLPQQALAGDGLITQTPAIVLAILTADCLPVILADTKRPAIGVLHAGWRGTMKRIVEKGVGEMRRCFGTQREILKLRLDPEFTVAVTRSVRSTGTV